MQGPIRSLVLALAVISVPAASAHVLTARQTRLSASRVQRVWAAAMTGLGAVPAPAFCRTAGCGVGDIATDLPARAMGTRMLVTTDPQGRVWVHDSTYYSNRPAYRIGLDGRIDRVLNVPGGAHVLAAASDGTVYVATEIDPASDTDRIFKVDAAGHATWFAGRAERQGEDPVSCVQDNCGDGGPALEARFEGIGDMVVDARGDLLIADAEHYRIRMITPAGVVSTIAGSVRCDQPVTCAQDGQPATSARLNLPYALGLAPNGSLWIADTPQIDGRDGPLLRVTPDGRLHLMLDGRFWGLAVSPQNVAYVRVYDKQRRPRLVAVGADGTASDAFGTPRSRCDESLVSLTCGDGGAAQSMSLSTQEVPASLAVDRWGGIFEADAGGEVRYIEPAGQPSRRLGLVIKVSPALLPAQVAAGRWLVIRYQASEPVAISLRVMRLAHHSTIFAAPQHVHGASGTITWTARVGAKLAPAGAYLIDVIAQANGRITSRQLPVAVAAR
jgi:hypothetical protein